MFITVSNLVINLQLLKFAQQFEDKIYLNFTDSSTEVIHHTTIDEAKHTFMKLQDKLDTLQ